MTAGRRRTAGWPRFGFGRGGPGKDWHRDTPLTARPAVSRRPPPSEEPTDVSLPRRPPALLAAPFLALALLLAGCSSGTAPEKAPVGVPGQGAAGPQSDAASTLPTSPGPVPVPSPAEIPDLGRNPGPDPRRGPAGLRGDRRGGRLLPLQRGPVQPRRTGPGWEPVAGPWPAHNGMDGWTDRPWRATAGRPRVSTPLPTPAAGSPTPGHCCRTTSTPGSRSTARASSASRWKAPSTTSWRSTTTARRASAP
ncbi:hypothetical protein SBADM41S_03833 [Streptomyces badius]